MDHAVLQGSDDELGELNHLATVLDLEQNIEVVVARWHTMTPDGLRLRIMRGAQHSVSRKLELVERMVYRRAQR